MPSKYYNRNFRPQHYYHVFNRGAYKNKIFLDKKDYEIFTSILTYYLNFPTAKHFSYQKRADNPYVKVPNLDIDSVHLVAYCLMPNHFHFILKQTPKATKQTNISNLMRRLMITYAMYFQNKYKHTGALLQGRFKNVVVDSKEQLLYLSKYIHENPLPIQKNLNKYPYSSYSAYINKLDTPKWLHPEYVLKLRPNYQQFIKTPTQESVIEKFTPLTLE